MQTIILCALIALASARSDYSAPRSSDSVVIPILRSNALNPSASGEYSFDFETGDGIFRSESASGSGPDGAVEQQGVVKFTFPTGEEYELSYVANAEGGYQPKSSWLPVAPEFPHPIPQYVRDQIEKAAREDAEAARANDAKSRSYSR